MEANDESTEARSSGTEKIWSGALAVAGAGVGLAAIIYFLGAASMWLALRGRGFSPDVAIEHQPRSQLIAIGVRGIFAVAVIVLFAAALGFLFRRYLPVSLRGSVVIGAIAIFVASWLGWRWLALAFAGTIALLINALDWKPELRPMGKAPFRWLLLLVAAVLTALAWQYGGPMRITRVAVLPRASLPFGSIYVEQRECTLRGGQKAESSRAYVRHWVWLKEGNDCHYKVTRPREKLEAILRRKCNSVPYFGQSADFVYLGAIRAVWLNEDGGCMWWAGGIVELRREKIRLVFFREKSNLNANRRRPIRAAWVYFRSFLGSLS